MSASRELDQHDRGGSSGGGEAGRLRGRAAHRRAGVEGSPGRRPAGHGGSAVRGTRSAISSIPRLGSSSPPTSTAGTRWCSRRRPPSTRSSPWPGTSASTTCSATATPRTTASLTGELERAGHLGADQGERGARSSPRSSASTSPQLLLRRRRRGRRADAPRRPPSSDEPAEGPGEGGGGTRAGRRSASRAGRLEASAGASSRSPASPPSSPAAAGGAAVALVRRDRQAGAELRRPAAGCPAVLRHQRRGGAGARPGAPASEPRPAVFVYNHRNNVDGFVAASLVEHDFVAVATRRSPTIRWWRGWPG